MIVLVRGTDNEGVKYWVKHSLSRDKVQIINSNSLLSKLDTSGKDIDCIVIKEFNRLCKSVQKALIPLLKELSLKMDVVLFLNKEDNFDSKNNPLLSVVDTTVEI